MSTKTTFKRVALVAVAALGLGVVSTIPANAATTISSISVGTLPAVRTGVFTVVPVTVNLSSATAADTFTIAAQVISAPTTGGNLNTNNGASVLGYTTATTSTSGSQAGLYFASDASGTYPTTQNAAAISKDDPMTATASNATVGYTGVIKSDTTQGNLLLGTTAAGKAAAAVAVTGAASVYTKTVYLAFKTDVSGSYSFLISASTASHPAYVAGDTSAMLTVSTGGTPSSVVLTQYGSNASPDGTYGALFKVAVLDANGAPATLSGQEAIKISQTGGTGITAATLTSGNFASQAVNASTATSVTLSSANMLNGVGFVNVDGAASAVVTLTASQTGSLATLTSGATSFTMGKAKSTTQSGNTFAAKSGTGVTTGWYGSSSPYNVPSTSTVDTVELTRASATTDFLGYITVTDTSGKITGIGSAGTNTLAYDQVYTVAAASTYVDVDIKHSAIGTSSYTVADSAGATIGTVTGASAAAANGTLTVTPSYVRVAPGGSMAFTVLAKDQYGNALSNSSITVTAAGRNSAQASQTVVTGSTGYATVNFVDTASSSSTLTSDVITFNGGVATNPTVTVNYSSVTASTVTVTGGNTADVAPAKTYTSISTGDIGYSTSGAVAFTATVKDASGNPLAGVPVTFKVDSGLILKTSTIDYSTVYTNTAGQAVSYAFAWVTGKQTITATAGTASGTGYANWRDDVVTQARTIAAKADSTYGNVITFTVTDRFGNGVKGANITLSRTGTGFFFGGASTTAATTGSDGTVAVQFTGAGTVTGTLDTTTEGYDIAGQVQATALKAAVAGTTTGTGVSFSTAGVGTASVTVAAGADASTSAANAATDAANEATDAANAATDAALAAADAADAATAAAQDASDAVASLASKVEAMVASLKAQITSLTNLVIKIQKKVKA